MSDECVDGLRLVVSLNMCSCVDLICSFTEGIYIVDGNSDFLASRSFSIID